MAAAEAAEEGQTEEEAAEGNLRRMEEPLLKQATMRRLNGS